MPRKKKDEVGFNAALKEEVLDNTIEFPVSAKNLVERTEEQVNQANQLAIQRIDQNRKAGLEQLERKCDNLDHRDMITAETPVDENTLRNLEQALKGALTALEALNTLVDMIRHDVITSVQNIEQQSIGQFQVSAHLQTLIALLIEKEAITDEEMRTMWEKVVKDRVKALREQAQT